MNSFWKTTLAVIVGVILASIISTALCIAIFTPSGSSTPSIPKSGVLKIDMSKIVLQEQATEANPFESLRGGNLKELEIVPVGLWDAVQAVNAAAEDPAVKYIYLKTDGNSSGLAQISELRASLENFRKSGKPVVSYLETPTTGSYYLASVADKVYMTACPGGNSMFSGISTTLIFLRDLLGKFGINVQLIRHGKYKSAGEMYTRSTPSKGNLEQNQVMINSIWSTISAQIASSRSISTEDINRAIDKLELCLPEDFVRCGLIDSTFTRGDLENKLATLAMVEKYSQVQMIPFADYVAARTTHSTIRKKIAVIYADGNIIDGSDISNVAGDRFAATVEKVCADSSIKAVVLRVNSPGGSVVASDKIKVELDKIKGTKPLIASYGSYAASGGYWISNNADKIFTDAVTLTGSIGVFGMIPEFSKTYKDIAHIGVATVGSNKHSDMFSLTRPFDKDEYAFVQRSIEDIYDRFTSMVADARGMTQQAVDDIAQGRVWTGADAIGIGLVDEIGTLEDAIHYAAVAAGDPELKNWNIKGYPKPLSVMEQIMASVGGQDNDYSIELSGIAGVFGPETARAAASAINAFGNATTPQVLARMPYEIVLK